MPIEVLEPRAPEMDSAGTTPAGAPVAPAALAVVFGGGLRLEIGEGFHAATLRRVLEVLGHVG